MPQVTTTVERARVKASYNGGVDRGKNKTGLFAKTADFFSSPSWRTSFRGPDSNITFPPVMEWSWERRLRLGGVHRLFFLGLTALGSRSNPPPPPIPSFCFLKKKEEPPFIHKVGPNIPLSRLPSPTVGDQLNLTLGMHIVSKTVETLPRCR